MKPIGAAQERLLRVMCFSLGLASLIFVGLNAPSIIANITQLQPWSAIFIALFGANALLLGGGSSKLPTRGLLLACAVHALLFAAALASTWSRPTSSPSEAPWIFNLAVLGAAAAGVAFAGFAGWVYLASVSVLLFGIAIASPDVSPFATPFHAAVLNTFFMALLFCIARATWRAGRLLDVAAESAIQEARAAATAAARAAEDVRIQALVHDSVLVALLAFARSSTSTEARAAAQAQRALDAMQSLEVASVPLPATPTQLIQTLQSLATEIAPDAIFVHEVTGDSLVVPPEVVQAFSESLGEALRNSVAHGGAPGATVERQVVATITPSFVSVIASDRGRGFDLDHVSPDRLGIQVGILGRMERLPGGAASIESRIGQGTLVRLQWTVA